MTHSILHQFWWFEIGITIFIWFLCESIALEIMDIVTITLSQFIVKHSLLILIFSLLDVLFAFSSKVIYVVLLQLISAISYLSFCSVPLWLAVDAAALRCATGFYVIMFHWDFKVTSFLRSAVTLGPLLLLLSALLPLMKRLSSFSVGDSKPRLRIRLLLIAISSILCIVSLLLPCYLFTFWSFVFLASCLFSWFSGTPCSSLSLISGNVPECTIGVFLRFQCWIVLFAFGWVWIEHIPILWKVLRPLLPHFTAWWSLWCSGRCWSGSGSSIAGFTITTFLVSFIEK